MATGVPSAVAASRAIGAMFYAGFGAVWLNYWAYRSAQRVALKCIVIDVCAVGLLLAAYRTYIHHRGGSGARSEAEEKHVGRWFQIINAAQWIGILVVVNILQNVGLGIWIVPAIMGVVGAHFLALAPVFDNRAHYVTGAALLLAAVAYPWLAPGGPAANVGALAAGLILWASAWWALSAHGGVADPHPTT